MRPRPKRHRRSETLPGGMISKEELERRGEELKARIERILTALAAKRNRVDAR